MAFNHEENSSSPPTRLGRCEICDANPSKYTCPRCDIKSCSLTCVKIHKSELDCSGLRDKTLYKPINKFTNLDLLSDYRLLEDINRSVTKYRKDINKRYTRYQTELPIQLYKLRQATYRRGVKLLFLPQNFSKHRENTNYFNWKTKELFWRLEWIFPVSTGIRKFIDERVLDTIKLGSVIAKYLCTDDPDSEMEIYYSASFSGISLLLKAEKTTGRFYELDACASVRENFCGKKIIEFPTIYVILKHQKDDYKMMDSDAEDNEQDCISTVEEVSITAV